MFLVISSSRASCRAASRVTLPSHLDVVRICGISLEPPFRTTWNLAQNGQKPGACIQDVMMAPVSHTAWGSSQPVTPAARSSLALGLSARLRRVRHNRHRNQEEETHKKARRARGAGCVCRTTRLRRPITITTALVPRHVVCKPCLSIRGSRGIPWTGPSRPWFIWGSCHGTLVVLG